MPGPYISDDSADPHFSSQSNDGHSDPLLLGGLDAVQNVAWIAGRQASKQYQHLYTDSP